MILLSVRSAAGFSGSAGALLFCALQPAASNSISMTVSIRIVFFVLLLPIQ